MFDKVHTLMRIMVDLVLGSIGKVVGFHG